MDSPVITKPTSVGAPVQEFMSPGDGATGSLPRLKAANTDLSELWSDLHGRCRNGDIAVVYETADALLALRRAVPDGPAWRAAISTDSFLELRTALREDPFAKRAAAKPRGYAGDAILLDYAYRLIEPPTGTTAMGRRIFDMTTNSPGSRSVRARKQQVSQWIDNLSKAFAHPRIASIACGHLRELSCSAAFQGRALGEFVAIDQDPESVRSVSEHYDPTTVTARCATVKEFLSGETAAGPFDALYAAGLFDYFDDDVATRALIGMLRMVRSRGRVLIANLTPLLIDIAYMEGVMDWWLIYRTEEQLRALARRAAEIVPAQIRTFRDLLGSVAYAEFVRDE